MKNIPNIFDYLSYRRFVKDWLKASGTQARLKDLAFDVGRSSAQISNILNGRRRLESSLVVRICHALKLSFEASEYFRHLVAIEDGKPPEQRAAMDSVAAIRAFRESHRLHAERHVLCSAWYYPAIFELSRCAGFQSDPSWIARKLNPSVPLAQVKSCLSDLVRMELLERDSQGRYRRLKDEMFAVLCEAPKNCGEDLEEDSVSSLQEGEARRFLDLALYTHHRTALEAAMKGMERNIPQEKRHYTGFASAIPAKAVGPLIERIKTFLNEFEAACNDEEIGEPDQVYQLSIQFLPLSEAL